MLSELKKVKHNLRALQGILSDRAALGQFEHRANANHWPLRPLASSTHGQSILKARMSAPRIGELFTKNHEEGPLDPHYKCEGCGAYHILGDWA